MPKRDSSYVTKLLILDYFINYSYEKTVRRKYLCLKPNDFKKQEGSLKNFITGKSEKVLLYSLSRKIFQRYRKELLEEKLITVIPTSDKRSTYYSITPFGICYLIKSEYFRDPDKITVKQQKKIFPILETFATRYVIPYRNELFQKEKFDFKDFYKKLIKNVIDTHDIGEEMPFIFSNFNHDYQLERLEFAFEFYVESPTKFVIANFKKLGQSEILLNELGQKQGIFYESIKLNEDQFHQYLASLLLLLIVYFHFQIRYSFNASRKITKKEISDYTNLPGYILKILSMFNSFIGKRINEEAEYMQNFTQIINKV